MSLMVTGGLGFIGSNFIQYIHKLYPFHDIINLDAETYAARTPLVNSKNIINERVNITDQAAVKEAFNKYKPEHLIHFAAESHVCRSISGPKDFIYTNSVGTWVILEEWKNYTGRNKRMIYVSTDEVFGELKNSEQPWTEQSPIKPRSPYAASKAAGDLYSRAYFETYGLNVCITNCSNNFGPNQHKEKLIPRTIERLLAGQAMSVYGSGFQIRDWLYVEDHCKALELILYSGKAGERYLIGGDNEQSNISVMTEVHRAMRRVCPEVKDEIVFDFVNARPTDDMRYAINSDKLKKLGWDNNKDKFQFNLENTIKWYIQQGFE